MMDTKQDSKMDSGIAPSVTDERLLGILTAVTALRLRLDNLEKDLEMENDCTMYATPFLMDVRHANGKVSEAQEALENHLQFAE